MNKPAISVVFTSYNHKEYLSQALDALLNQTFTNFELIIIDDCSSDGSRDILKEYAAKDSRIKLYLNDKNSGSYVISTNYGASLAVAPYIIFEQCDDWAEANQLELLYEAIQKNNVGVAFSSSNMVDETGAFIDSDFNSRSLEFQRQNQSDRMIPCNVAYRYLLESCIIPNLSAAIVSRALFERLGGLSKDYLVLADWDFWLRLALLTDFYYIRKPLNNFRQHKNTIRSSIRITKQIKELFHMYGNVLTMTPQYRNTILLNASFCWIATMRDNVKEWWKCMPELYKEGKKLDPRWGYYTLRGMCSIVKYVFMLKIFKPDAKCNCNNI